MKKLNICLTLCGLVIILFSCGSNDMKQNQMISFSYFAPHNLSEGSFILKATASSGLPVTFFSSDSTIASIRDSIITLHKPGEVEITAAQTGNAKYYEASKVIRSLTINWDGDAAKLNQKITFFLTDTVWKLSYGPLYLQAKASSGLPVTFTSNDILSVSITGNILTIISGINGVTVVITASQAGDYEYNSAPTVSDTLRVIHDVH